MRFAPDMLKAGAVILDANYASRTIEVRDKGYRVIDGREWLLFQGVKAFEHFAGIKPPIDVMRDALYEDREERHKRGNICIVGFMGTGKSSVAIDVSRLTGMGLFDMDCEIEERSGLSITGIFSQIGEEAIQVGDMRIYCTGPRTHVHRSGEIENFRLLKEFRLNPLTNDFMLIGMVGQKAIAGFEDIIEYMDIED